MEIIDLALPIVYILVGVALIWFLIELVLTVRKTRGMVTDVQRQIEPTLANVEQITTDVQPLMERVQLTVDAANLELMRADEILADVSTITDTASKAVGAVNTVTNAPVDLVNTIADKIRGKFGSKSASDESIRLGEKKAASNGELPNKKPVDNLVDAAADAIEGVAKKTSNVAEGDAADAAASDAAGDAAVEADAPAETAETAEAAETAEYSVADESPTSPSTPSASATE